MWFCQYKICSKHSVFLIVFAHLNIFSDSCSHCYPTGSATVCNVGWNREYCLDEMDGLCSTTPGKTRLDGYNEACKPKGTLPFNTVFKS